MNLSECITIIKDIVVTLAAATTAGIAYMGLSKWKEELKGKAHFEVARELLKSIYKARDEMFICRSPMIMAYEFPESYNMLDRTKTSAEEGEAYIHVYNNRMKPVQEAMQKFDIVALEAEVLWADDIKKQMDDFHRCFRELHTSIGTYIRAIHRGENYRRSEDPFHKKIMLNVESSKEDEDPLTVKINNSIKEIEKVLKPHLKR